MLKSQTLYSCRLSVNDPARGGSTGGASPRYVTTKRSELMGEYIMSGYGATACVKMLWGERRGHGTMGAVQRLPMELTHVATFSF
jgi:hypothetical protein